MQAAKTGADCHNYENQTGVEFFKNCCEACKTGMILGNIQEECSLGVFYGVPFDDSYNYCCNEMKSSDSFVLSEDESKWSEVEKLRKEKAFDQQTIFSISFFPLFELDICTKFENLCSQICEATDDSYVCKCESGFKLADDKKTCVSQEDESSSTRSNEVTVNSTE